MGQGHHPSGHVVDDRYICIYTGTRFSSSPINSWNGFDVAKVCRVTLNFVSIDMDFSFETAAAGRGGNPATPATNRLSGNIGLLRSMWFLRPVGFREVEHVYTFHRMRSARKARLKCENFARMAGHVRCPSPSGAGPRQINVYTTIWLCQAACSRWTRVATVCYTIGMSGRLRNGQVPTLPCACANLRRAARVVTALYDEELRPAGLRCTQYVLLQVLAAVGEMTQGEIGRLLALDSTTLTRSLALVARRGLLESRPGRDRRERLWRLTAAGRREFKQLERHWERAEARLKNALGANDWDRLRAVLERVVRAVEGD